MGTDPEEIKGIMPTSWAEKYQKLEATAANEKKDHQFEVEELWQQLIAMEAALKKVITSIKPRFLYPNFDQKCAESEADLFPSQEARALAFRDLLDALMKSSGAKNVPEIAVNENSSTFFIVASGSYSATATQLPDMVTIVCSDTEEATESKIELLPEFGSTNHDFTINDISPLADVDKDEFYKLTSVSFSVFISYEKGLLATEENHCRLITLSITKGEMWFPLRVGYRLFPRFVLEAMRKVKEIHPEWIETSEV